MDGYGKNWKSKLRKGNKSRRPNKENNLTVHGMK